MNRRLAALLALTALLVVGPAAVAWAQLGDLAEPVDELEGPGGVEPAFNQWQCPDDEGLPEPVLGTILNEADLVQRVVEFESGQPLPVDISAELADQLGCSQRDTSSGFVFEDELSGELGAGDDVAAVPVGTEPGAMLPATGLGAGGAVAGLVLASSAVALRRLLAGSGASRR